MKITNKRRALLLMTLPLSAAPLTTLAAVPASSPYVTDPQNTYVQDATSEGISNLNMVLCIMHSMDMSDMVNKGPYVALVDKNKCDSKSQSSTSNSTSGATGATSAHDYMTAVVDVTRASDSDPMVGKVWMSLTEEGHQVTVYVHLTATQSPTDAPPYGQFRVDYIGKSGGNTVFNGFVDASGADVKFLERDPNGSSTSENSLAMTASSTTAGAGTMNAMDFSGSTPQQVTFNFAYSPDFFRRSDGSNDVCFDRSKANAQRSVWRYGTYDAATGERVDEANPGFPIQASYGGQTYYGYAGYWGINFQGLDLNSFADGTVSGVTVSDQRPNQTGTTYTLSKSGGKLTKWMRNQAQLSAMDGVPFTFWGDLTNLTDNTTEVSGFNSWQMKWDDANQKFIVIGHQDCSSGNGCVMTALQQAATVNAGAFNNTPISGWSDAFGGNINIPPVAQDHASGDEVDYYTQSDVIPGSAGAPTALQCLSNCPTATSIGDFTAGNVNSPFDPATETQWNAGNNKVDYTFGSAGLAESSQSLAVTDATKLTGQYMNGIMSGRLFDPSTADALSTAGCANSATYCEPANPSVYYVWQTGANPWNQTMWLTHSGTVVTFDPPETAAYDVPNDTTAYGTWAGRHVQLQFNGFGNLNGIPGSCVSSTDNQPVDCSQAGARYVPAFALPDGAQVTLSSSNRHVMVKALDAEMRLAKVSCSTTGMAQPQTVAGMPTAADVHDPSDAADSDYLGTEPAVTDAPKVIDGVKQ